MDVKTVCLGMLTEGEASGYDLKKQFESTFGHFFAAGYGSIYPALSGLAKDGLVDCEQIPQDGKPDRKVYRITQRGRDHLLKALQNPRPCHKVRSEFLATMCFAHLMTPEQIRIVLDNQVKDAKKHLAMFNEFEHACVQDWPAGAKFVLGWGQLMMQTITEYIEDNRHKLLDDTEPTKHSAVG